MHLVFVITLVALCMQTCRAAGTGAYIARFSPSSTGGVSGSFEVKVNSNGGAAYAWSIDANNFKTQLAAKCAGYASGLTYHIHSYWKNGTSASAALEGCAAGVTGGHYDPFLACSTSSQSVAGNCTLLGRTVSAGYSYSCKYSSGHYETCELGDLSGKFGYATPVSASDLTFSGSEYDVAAPIAANYYNGTSRISQYPWNSIVFHCPQTNTRLFCANLVEQTYSGDDDNDSSTSSSSKYSDKEVTGFIIAMSIFIVLFVVLLAQYVFTCAAARKKEDSLLYSNNVN